MRAMWSVGSERTIRENWKYWSWCLRRVRLHKYAARFARVATELVMALFCAELLVVCVEWMTCWSCQCFALILLPSHLAKRHSILCSKFFSLWMWRHFYTIYFLVFSLITITLLTWSICQLYYNTIHSVEINEPSSMCPSAVNRTAVQACVFFSTHSHCLVK